MATVTPNFNWPVPTSTDLVKDGATAIEALGDSIDASLVDLKGGTTGQVLSKNSNTDMDFTWVTDAAGDITGVTAGTGISGGGTSGTVTVTNSMATAIDAKGDLVPGTGADTFARLAVGANGTVLTADSAEATGLKWATPAAGMTNPMTTTGDIIYSSPGSTPVRRGIGTTGQVLTVSGGVPTWSTPASGGKVLQVVQGTTTTSGANATSTYADTTLTATITPSAASSKILVLVAQNGTAKTSGTTSQSLDLRLLRGGTQIAKSNSAYTNTSLNLTPSTVSFNILDEPATTSATTYKTQFASASNSSEVRVQANSDTSTIILLEIGA